MRPSLHRLARHVHTHRTGEGEGEEEEEEEEEPKPEIKLETPPTDWRFPAQNQAKHCYTRYQEFHKCESQRGEGAEECAFFKRAYKSICPNDWVEEWDEQRDEGTFPGRY